MFRGALPGKGRVLSIAPAIVATLCLGLWQGTALAADPLAPAEDSIAATSGDVAGASQEVVETEAVAAPAEELTAEPASEPVTETEPVAEASAEAAPEAAPADVDATDTASTTQDVATDASQGTEQATGSAADEPAPSQVDDPAASAETTAGAAESSVAATPDSGSDGAATASTGVEKDAVSDGAAVVQGAAADVAGSAGAVNDEVEGAAQTGGLDDTAVAGTSVLDETAQATADTGSAIATDPQVVEQSDAAATTDAPVLAPIGDPADSSELLVDVIGEVAATQEAVTGDPVEDLSDGVDQIAAVVGISLDSLSAPAGDVSSDVAGATEAVEGVAQDAAASTSIVTHVAATTASNLTEDAAGSISDAGNSLSGSAASAPSEAATSASGIASDALSGDASASSQLADVVGLPLELTQQSAAVVAGSSDVSAIVDGGAALVEEIGGANAVAASLEPSLAPAPLVPERPDDAISSDPVHTLTQLVLASPAPSAEEVSGESLSVTLPRLVDRVPIGGATQPVGAVAGTSALGQTDDGPAIAVVTADSAAEQDPLSTSLSVDRVVLAPSSTTPATVGSPLSLANEDTSQQGSAFPEELVSLPGAEATGGLGTPQGDGDGRVRFAPSAAAFVRREVLHMTAAEATVLMANNVPGPTGGPLSWTPGWLPFTGFILLLPLVGGALLLMTGGRVALWCGKRATG